MVNPNSSLATQMSKWNQQNLTLVDVFHLQVEAWYKDSHSLRTFSIQQLNDLEKTQGESCHDHFAIMNH